MVASVVPKRLTSTGWVPVADAGFLPLTGGNLTGGITVTGGNVTAPRFISTVATGTAPFAVTSQTVVANLNADKVDGQDGPFVKSDGTVAMTGILTAPRVQITGATAGVVLDDRDGVSESWQWYNNFNTLRAFSSSEGTDRFQMSGTSVYWPGNTEFVLGNSVGASPSWRFHWNGSSHYMDWLGGTGHPLILRPGAGVENIRISGRNHFKDSEVSTGTGLRVGAAWGMYGTYSEDGWGVMGGASGASLQNNRLRVGTNGFARIGDPGVGIAHGAGGSHYATTDANGYFNIPHGMGGVPHLCWVVPASIDFTYSGGSDPVNTVYVTSWNETNIVCFVRETDNTSATSSSGWVRWGALWFG